MPWPDALLTGIARSVNHLAARDPAFTPRLDALEGRCLRIEVEGADRATDIRIESSRINLSTAGEATPDVTISGAPLALLGLLRANDPMEELQSGRIHIRGEMRIAQRFSALFKDLDIDWEELLAEKIGDLPAHQAGRWLRRFVDWRRRTHTAWERAIGEFLQEEARYLPTRVEIEHFLDQVDAVRDGAERLEARLALLEKQLKQ